MKFMKNLFFLLFLMFITGVAQSADRPIGIIELDGKTAPALKLSDSNGKVSDLKTMRGKWVLVHFWASWCGPCRKEMPSIQSLSKTIPASKMPIILVNTSESEDTVFEFMSIIAPELESTLDLDGSVTGLWQPRGLPSSFFVDPRGKLRYLALGGRPWMRADYLSWVKQVAGSK